MYIVDSQYNILTNKMEYGTLLSAGTQTKQSEDDDPETYDLPLVQEPIDFPIPQENEELFQELRQRRLNWNLSVV